MTPNDFLIQKETLKLNIKIIEINMSEMQKIDGG